MGVERPTVTVARPAVGKVVDYAYFTGRTEAPESVNVQSRVTGYLTSIDFTPGAEVKANQRLFLIDPRPYQAALDRADGQVQLAEARLKLAKADYARAVEIAKTPGAISQQDVDKYAAARGEATAAVAAAEANRESARLNVEFTSVVSPVDGVVGRNLLTLGNLVRQDDTLLATVVSQDPMYAYFDIDEYVMLRVMRLIKEGQITQSNEKDGLPIEMGLADEGELYPHQGRIDFINNRMDPTTGTLQIRGTFANPTLGFKNLRILTPGMFVRVRLPIGPAHDALLVPEAAICADQGKKYVLVVGADNLVEYRPITLGARQPDAMQAIIPVKMIRTKDGLRRADEQDGSHDKMFDSLTADDRVIVDGL
ncbi:MAG: efflux RND transporter periplasmic adaptor subunit, partial [Pirellulaceae bacterium]|nr:efflux RND transporter periplasmic adaptor subunit [Pirellulaceae bacterium]